MSHARRIGGRPTRLYVGLALLVGVVASGSLTMAQYPADFQIFKDGTSVLIEDYASIPISSLRLGGVYPAPIDYRGQLGKANTLVSEPKAAPRSAVRFFVPGQNGTLYLLDKTSKEFTPYVDFGKIYAKFTTDPNLGMGLVSMQFDPGYAKNGKFYTVHSENPALSGSSAPSNESIPALKWTGFTTTTAINPPAGKALYENVVTEWTDSNIGNATFEGTSREIMRVGNNFPRHPMADLVFNPLAKPGDADYGNLYISVGDGEAGERAGVTHPIPQRLDALQGKILRITPDITLRPNDKLSENGRYRIPSTGADANPFTTVATARPEIYAYGFRNPHRMSWDPVSNVLLASDIGNHSWEELNIVTKGTNYGWAEREGPEQTFVEGGNGGRTGSQIEPAIPFPSPDTVIVAGLDKPVTPKYPAAVFSHREGLAIGSAYVYRGKLMPQLVGKVVFTDIATGRLFYADLKEMIAGGGMAGKQAKVHELQVMFKGPHDPAAVKWRMFDVVAQTYLEKKGQPTKPCVLPDGSSNANTGLQTCGSRGQGKDPYGVEYGGGRADVRLAMDGDGELYAMSKADGMIRKLTKVVSPPSDFKTAAR